MGNVSILNILFLFLKVANLNVLDKMTVLLIWPVSTLNVKILALEAVESVHSVLWKDITPYVHVLLVLLEILSTDVSLTRVHLPNLILVILVLVDQTRFAPF